MLLSNFDELAQTVRNPEARAYIWEAIATYRAGAYRAATTAAWVTVSYDLIGKFANWRRVDYRAASK